MRPRLWDLELDVSLVLGAWDLELWRSQCFSGRWSLVLGVFLTIPFSALPPDSAASRAARARDTPAMQPAPESPPCLRARADYARMFDTVATQSIDPAPAPPPNPPPSQTRPASFLA